MVTKEEALKLALDALEYMDGHYLSLPQQGMQALTAIKEALAQTAQKSLKEMTEADFDAAHDIGQPAQEPVAFAVVVEGKFGLYEIGQETETDASVCKYWENRGYTLIPLYTTPPQRPWVGLTMEEFLYILDNCRTPSTYLSMVEAKLKEKNS